MICPACGKANIDASAFCEQCGTRLQAQPAASPAAAVPAPTARSAVRLSGSLLPPHLRVFSGWRAASALIASMSLGEKISGAGAVAAAVGFFLPWVSVAGVASLKTASTWRSPRLHVSHLLIVTCRRRALLLFQQSRAWEEIAVCRLSCVDGHELRAVDLLSCSSGPSFHRWPGSAYGWLGSVIAPSRRAG